MPHVKYIVGRPIIVLWRNKPLIFQFMALHSIQSLTNSQQSIIALIMRCSWVPTSRSTFHVCDRISAKKSVWYRVFHIYRRRGQLGKMSSETVR